MFPKAAHEKCVLYYFSQNETEVRPIKLRSISKLQQLFIQQFIGARPNNIRLDMEVCLIA